nr:unnamed protein product [Callosobruchus analis]
MYTLYSEICKKDDCKPVSLITYKRTFAQNYNYSLFHPKKDQCQVCMSYKSQGSERSSAINTMNTSPEKTTSRISRVTCLIFSAHHKFLVATSVPCIAAVYELAPPNNAFFYAWRELNGKRGSLEIGTCSYRYINNLPSTVSELILYSDTCSGQNRNQNISTLLLYLVQKNPNVMVIEQRFLKSGDTYV